MKINSNKGALVGGGLMILFGVMSLVQVYVDLSPWVWIVVFAAAGAGVIGLYYSDQSEGWLLIPGYVLWAIAALILLTTLNLLRGEAVAFFVLSLIGLPFLFVYLRNRQNWWALIPAYVLFAVGLMVGLLGWGILNDLLVPAYVMFAIAIPFFFVYARNPKNWWALIPAGIMSLIGFSFLIAESAIEFIIPAVLIIVGAWILIRQFRRKDTEEPYVSSGEVDEQGE